MTSPERPISFPSPPRPIDRIILRYVSACASSREAKWIRESFVTPSTIPATVAPNSVVSSSVVVSVSSTTSCNNAAATTVVGWRSCAQICATASGWLTNGSPERRN